MATKYEGTKRLGFAIHPTGNKPLDDRMVVDHKSDLTSGSTFDGAHYDGMIVAVVEDKKAYMLVDSNNITAETSWVCLGSNVEGGSIDENQIKNLISANSITSIVSGETVLSSSGTFDISSLTEYFYDKAAIDGKITNPTLFEIIPGENLPQTGETNLIYLLNVSGDVGNVFEEHIYVNNKWESIGSIKTDIGDLILKTDTITLSNEITGDTSYVSGSTLQNVLQDISDRISEPIDIVSTTTISSLTTNSGLELSVLISEKSGNTISVEDDGLYVANNLEDRLAALEAILTGITGTPQFVTMDNISRLIVPEKVNSNGDTDITMEVRNGQLVIGIDSITNIAYADAEEITEE